MPCGTILSWKSLLFTTASSSAFIFSMIGCGVPFGAKMPAQWPMRTFGKPDSAVVGIFGAALILSYVVAMAFSLPALICGSTTMLASDVACTLPEITAVTLSLPLLYGTIVTLTPYSFSISATKCGVLPVPAVAHVMPLGCCFAHATNS